MKSSSRPAFHERQIVHHPHSHGLKELLLKVHPSGDDPSPSEADLRLTRRIIEASKILQLQLIDHVIIGSPVPGRSP